MKILLFILEIIGGLLGLIIGLLLLLFLLCFVSSLFVDPKKEYNKSSGYYRFLLNTVTFVAMKILRVRLHTSGMEYIPQGPFVLVGNHLSNFDPIVTWAVLTKYKMAFISKPENFKVPIFGRIVQKCCYMPIDREDPREAMKAIRRASDLLSKGEVNICVYPEGTRNKTGEGLLPFHNGVFKIAQKANVPVCIVCVRGARDFNNRFPWHHTDMYIDFLETIPAEFVKEHRTNETGDLVRDKLLEKLN